MSSWPTYLPNSADTSDCLEAALAGRVLKEALQELVFIYRRWLKDRLGPICWLLITVCYLLSDVTNLSNFSCGSGLLYYEDLHCIKDFTSTATAAEYNIYSKWLLLLLVFRAGLIE